MLHFWFAIACLTTVIFPSMRMMTVALEAARQTSQSQSRQEINGYNIKEVWCLNPILIPETADQKTETMLHLRPKRKLDRKQSVWFGIAIYGRVL